MTNKNPDRLYRIGDHARHLGVTPDLLKYYEKQGILKAKHSAAGFRYFPFEEAACLLQCLELKNYGLSLDEVADILNDANTDGALRILDKHAEEIRRRVERETAVLAEHDALKAWLEDRRSEPSDWEITETEDYLFLPHSKGKDFLSDPKIAEIKSEWMSWMPVVRTGIRVLLDSPGSYYWGFLVPRSKAERLGLPVNDAVQHLPGGKHFVFHEIAERIKGQEGDSLIHRRHPLFRQMEALQLAPTKELFMVVLMKNSKERAGIYVVPFTRLNPV